MIPMLSVMTMKSGFIYKLDASKYVHILSINLEKGFDAELQLHSHGSKRVLAKLDTKHLQKSIDMFVYVHDSIALKSETNATVDVLGYIEGFYYGVPGKEFKPLETVFHEMKIPTHVNT
ncbi:uncharacterized protein LOC121404763 [Drosophila obscura]|uniref:uncharacterized protein LOC121404763 n=1 Tax=Drosophila obscura TaxID=7282 RepID=UPI001BB1E71B|nr:uncharacterized protein LOC121404763 [Drosophila obscura]